MTGGTRGIGAAIAARFEAAGEDVVAVGRSECDVTDEDAVAALFERVGAVDVLVNNAGVSDSAPLARTTLAAWRAQLDVNATGAFLCTRAALPAMRERDSGRIVTVASTAGLIGAKYTAGVHGVQARRRRAHPRGRGRGRGHRRHRQRRLPGFVRTDMTRESLRRITATTGRSEAEGEAALAAARRSGGCSSPARSPTRSRSSPRPRPLRSTDRR